MRNSSSLNDPSKCPPNPITDCLFLCKYNSVFALQRYFVAAECSINNAALCVVDDCIDDILTVFEHWTLSGHKNTTVEVHGELEYRLRD